MTEFIEIPASKKSLALRSPLLGVGLNDATYFTENVIDGKRIRCPFYQKWTHMLTRCYCEKYLHDKPTYKYCTVCDEWLIFSNFKKWMKKQIWQGKELDKDILVKGNKIYSPSTCLMVTREINLLISDNLAAKGEYSTGVHLRKFNGRFQARCSVNGIRRNLGHYRTPQEAEGVYKKFKRALIIETALKQIEPLKGALIRLANDYA